jgi:hypothetical protein
MEAIDKLKAEVFDILVTIENLTAVKANKLQLIAQMQQAAMAEKKPAAAVKEKDASSPKRHS